MRETRYQNGFTLVELLMALMVTSIIAAAVATLAYAMGAANDVSDNTSRKQAQVRIATLRISELIRHSKLICRVSSMDLAVWRADDNGDGQINPTELVYIEAGPSRNFLRLREFLSGSGSVPLSGIQDGSVKSALISSYNERRVVLVQACNNVVFTTDVVPPNSKFVNVSFNLGENGVLHQYQISASLRGWAGNLLSGGGIVSDDD